MIQTLEFVDGYIIWLFSNGVSQYTPYGIYSVRESLGDEKASSVLGNYVRHVWLLDYIYIPTLVIGRRVSPEGRCANTCL